MSKGQTQQSMQSGGRTLERCKSQATSSENIEIIDVDSGDPDVIVIDDPGPSNFKQTRETSPNYVISIDDDDDDDEEEEEDERTDAYSSKDWSERRRRGQSRCSIPRNRYGLDCASDSELFGSDASSSSEDSSEALSLNSDSSDCDVVLDDSSGSIREEWERAHFKRRRTDSTATAGGVHAPSSSDRHREMNIPDVECTLNRSFSDNLNELLRAFRTSTGNLSNLQQEEVRKGGLPSSSSSSSSSCCMPKANTDHPSADPVTGVNVSDGATTTCQEEREDAGKCAVESECSDKDDNLGKQTNVNDNLNVNVNATFTSFVQEELDPAEEGPFEGKSREEADPSHILHGTCSGAAAADVADRENNNNNNGSDCFQHAEAEAEAEPEPEPERERDNEEGLDAERCAAASVLHGESFGAGESSKVLRDDAEEEEEERCILVVVGERERHKESEEYRRADEQEWASRQLQLRIQAEEAQRLKKRRKAESMRLLDMEKRQKQRLEEIRQTQKLNEETMSLKEELRAQVRKELELMERRYSDMPSILRGLGVQVQGGLFPLTTQIKAAYKQALLRFHPDRVPNSDIHQQVKAEETFKFISRMKEKLLPVA